MTDPSLIKTIANIITNNLITQVSKTNKPVDELMSNEHIVELANLFNSNKINNQGLSKAIDILVESPDSDLQTVLSDHNLIQITDVSTLEVVVDTIIKNYPAQVESYKIGKINIIGFLVGQCMKQSAGNGNPKIFNELIAARIKVL